MDGLPPDDAGAPVSRVSLANKPMLLALKAVLLGVVLTFVGRYVSVHWQEVRDVPAPRVGPLLWASVWGVVSSIGAAAILGRILAAHGSPVPLRQAIGLYHLPALGKYLPGKFWSLLASLWLFLRAGVPKHVAATSIGLNLIIVLLSCSLTILALHAKQVDESALTGTLIAASVALVLGLHPRVFYPFVNWLFRRLGQPPLEAKLSFAGLVGLVIAAAATWALYGLGMYYVLVSVTPLPLSDAPQCIATFLFAQVVGFLALFAPAGIGVREGVLLVGLRRLVGPGPAIVAVALTRLWQTALDLVMAGVGWWLMREKAES